MYQEYHLQRMTRPLPKTIYRGTMWTMIMRPHHVLGTLFQRLCKVTKLLTTLIIVFNMGTNVAIGIGVGCLTTILRVLKTWLTNPWIICKTKSHTIFQEFKYYVFSKWWCILELATFFFSTVIIFFSSIFISILWNNLLTSSL